MFPNQINGHGFTSFPANQGARAGGDGPGLPTGPRVVAQDRSRMATLASVALPPPLPAPALPRTTSTPSLGTKRAREDEVEEREQTRLRQLTEQEQEALATRKKELLHSRSATYDASRDAELAETLHEALRSGRLQELTLKSLAVSSSAPDLALYQALSASKLRRLQIEGVVLAIGPGMDYFVAALGQISSLRALVCNGTDAAALVVMVSFLPQLKALSADLSTDLFHSPQSLTLQSILLQALTTHRGIEQLSLRGVDTRQRYGDIVDWTRAANSSLKHLDFGFTSLSMPALGMIVQAVASSSSLKSVVVSKPDKEQCTSEQLTGYIKGVDQLIKAARHLKSIENLQVWLPRPEPSQEVLQRLIYSRQDAYREMFQRRLATHLTAVIELLACCVAVAKQDVNNDVLGQIAAWMLLKDPLLGLRLQDQ